MSKSINKKSKKKYDTNIILTKIDRLNNRIDNIYFNKIPNPNISDKRHKELYDEVDKLEKERRFWELKL